MSASDPPNRDLQAFRDEVMRDASLPSQELLARQAEWLAPARARILRRAGIARRRRVLDLACGFGAVTGELVRRSGARVVALDRRHDLPAGAGAEFDGAFRVAADAGRLPFADGSFDLVFCQFALLWLDARAAIAEVHRVLRPAGVLVAMEPDYGGMIEHPPGIATRRLWLAGLARAGADPTIGRRLPGLLKSAGFSVRVDLLERLEPASPLRFDFLRELPLSADERQALADVEAADRECVDCPPVVHLPVFLLTATK
jgi:SAM-dependent methyltransferase